jgi:hypothetical protein
MSYFEKTRILSADSPSVDAFGKWRVSNQTTVFNHKQVSDSGSFYYDINTVNGGIVTWQSGSANSILSVTTTSGSRAIKQTKQIFPYQPGKSQLIMMTGNFGTGVAGVKKIMGSFDEEDGYYFQMSGSNFGIGLRSTLNSVFTDTFVSQSSWNLDKMDGSGPSGNTLDVTKSQIFTVDYEWLGVGRVRYGIVFNGSTHYVHEINNNNTLNSVYLKNPNLPVRAEIAAFTNTSTESNFKVMCSTVISEGGVDNTGRRVPVTSLNGCTISTSQYGAVLAVRYKNKFISSTQSIPESLKFLVEPGNNSSFSGRWDLLVNPTISDAMSWQDVSGSVNLECAIFNPNASNITNSGTVISTGYFAGTAGGGIGENISLDPNYGLGRTVNKTSDILVLGIKAISNNYDIYPTMTIRELT